MHHIQNHAEDSLVACNDSFIWFGFNETITALRNIEQVLLYNLGKIDIWRLALISLA